MAAAASGSAPVVRAILERGADADIVMVRTKTHAAHEAAKGGFFDVVSVMGAYGVSFDPYDDKGENLNGLIYIRRKEDKKIFIQKQTYYR